MYNFFRNLKFYINVIFFSVLFIFSNCTSLVEASSFNFCKENLPSLSNTIDKVISSVVSIDAEGFKTLDKKDNNEMYEDNFVETYKNKHDKKLENRYFSSLGSGIIIDSKNGYVVTNSHVISNSYKINVKLNDGRIFNAKVIGVDDSSDIALIKLIKAKNLVSIKFCDSDKVRVGDYAIAIGNPYGLGNTATYGIVSAIGRNGLNIENYENFIQTDASINRGSSGGALVNLNGELIGLNTAILSPGGGNIGIGFSIPSNMVKNLIKQIEKYGKVQNRELGIIGIEINQEISNAMNLNINTGIFVSEVISDSVAEKCGMSPGDIIISMNHKRIKNFLSFKAEIYSFPLDKNIELDIIRDGQIKHLFIKMSSFENFIRNDVNTYKKIPGLIISMIKKNGNNIIKVNYVKFNSYAYKLGFRKNDIIININKNNIYSLKELDNFVSKKNILLIFYIKRANSNIYLFMKL
ncbi:Do family serine endopeptidase [Buchnera aphidicola]|uniref:Do family serine endopeptidase n=1 Tax=Buchnera aphidicola TaxID=9 RepID=UPI0031B83F95